MIAEQCIKSLLYDDVIENTYHVMQTLRRELKATEVANDQLRELLLLLCSESIREALHKHELRITNDIIAHKNRILRNSGVEVPAGHEIIDPFKYSHTW